MSEDDTLFENLQRVWSNCNYLKKQGEQWINEANRLIETGLLPSGDAPPQAKHVATKATLVLKKREVLLDHAKQLFLNGLERMFGKGLVVTYRETSEGIFAKVGYKEYQPKDNK